MLRGMMGSMLGVGPEVMQAIRNDPELMQSLADPRVMQAMQDIAKDPDNLSYYEDDLHVMQVLGKVDLLSGPGGATSSTGGPRLEPEELATLEEAEQQRERQAELQRLWASRSRREAARKLLPLTYDVDDWMSMPWYSRTTEIGRRLAQKGFCILAGGLEAEARDRAVLEAARLKRSGAFMRPPREVLSGMFGEQGSAWTRELSDPNREAPPEDEALRAIDSHISELGGEVAGCTEGFFGMRIQGRTVGVAHYSKLAEDRPNPPLVDPDEADGYMGLFVRKKLKMVYYVGPSVAITTIAPIGDEERAFRMQLHPGTILVLRGDAVRCSIEPKSMEHGLTVEVDFLAEQKLGPQENARDRVPPPEALEQWYLNRLAAIVDNDVMENVPDDWMKLARETYYKNNPARLRELSHDLPSTVRAADKWVCPFEACALGGNDCITEIPLSKWDITAYYDEDPMSVDDFKMYTRHMGVLDRGHPPSDDYNVADFGIAPAEAKNIDHRHLMLCESATLCLRMADMRKEDTQGKDVGVFCGISGNEMYYQFITREAKLSKSTCTNMSNAANVNRLSYLFGSTGPSVAIDTEDSSGSGAVDTAVTYIREERCDLALVGGVSFIQHPFSLIIYCASGSISRTGRARVFDESSDGVIRSEGVVTMLLEAHKKKQAAEMAEGNEAEGRYRALIQGSALNSKGVSSSLTAPSAPAILDVLRRALKDAQCPASVLHSLDMNASGNSLADAMELGMMKKGLVSSEEKPHTVAIRSFKCVLGETGAPSGLVSIARAVLSLEAAVHGPCIHLHEFFEIGEAVAAEDYDGSELFPVSRLHIPVELMEARSMTQIVGVNSFGSSGTNVHQILWGRKSEEQREPYLGQAIHWFPAGAAKAPEPAPEEPAAASAEEFFIMGTWNSWQRPLKMREESPGVFSHVGTLGENRWETFQIWMDGNPDQVLHPPCHWSDMDGEVCGPSPQSACGRCMNWIIRGLPLKVRMINQEQFKQLKELKEAGVTLPESEEGLAVSFRGDYRPPGFETAADYTEMPTMEMNTETVGVPGDQYLVRLHMVAGSTYRRVEWKKLPSRAPAPAAEEVAHTYYLVGDDTYWTFSPMEALSEKPGVYRAEIQLLHDSGTFQIIRDKDWDQTFYPSVADAGAEATMLGPDPFGGLDKCWRITGEAGEVFRVEFHRTVSAEGEDSKSVAWEALRKEPLDFEEMAKAHKYHVVGSWDDLAKMAEMDLDEDTGTFSTEVRIGSSGSESFQILLDGNWLAAVHPSANLASFRDEHHQVEGPDKNGSSRYWLIGKHQEDGIQAGDHVRIFLVLEGGLPKRVHWERFDAEVHRQYVETGCQSILDEQCEKLGL